MLDVYPLELVELTRHCIEVNKEYAKGFGVDYKLLCSQDSQDINKQETPCQEQQVFIMGNKRRVEQAINNLLSNAARHGVSNDSVEIVISHDHKMARLEVRDQGPGIPAAFISCTFEKFSHLAKEKSLHNSGHGLATLYHIAKLHHGHVGYNIRSGYGAVFFIERPLAPNNPAHA